MRNSRRKRLSLKERYVRIRRKWLRDQEPFIGVIEEVEREFGKEPGRKITFEWDREMDQ